MNSVHLSKISSILSNSNNLNSKHNTTPIGVHTKPKHKENGTIKKLKNINSCAASGKNKKFTEDSISPVFLQKRKFDQIENLTHQEEIITQTRYLIYKIDELYDKFSSRIFGKEWKEEFLFELKQENIVETSELFPKSLNTRGSHLLEYTKFWILLIEYKFSELDLVETLMIFNNAILYDQNDFQLLYEYLVKILEENFEKKEIFSILEKKNGANHFRVPDKLEDLTREHYRFLLEKPEVFRDAKTVKSQYIFTPISNKAQKLLSEIQILNSNSSKTGVYNTNSNHKVNSMSKTKIAVTSNSRYDFEFRQEESYPAEEKAMIKGFSLDSTQSREKITGPKRVEDYLNEETISIRPENCLTYPELVQRNKLRLIVEVTSRVDYVKEVNEDNMAGDCGEVEHRVDFDLNDKKLLVNIDANSLKEKIDASDIKYIQVEDEKEINIKNDDCLKSNKDMVVAKEAQNKKKKNHKKKKKK